MGLYSGTNWNRLTVKCSATPWVATQVNAQARPLRADQQQYNTRVRVSPCPLGEEKMERYSVLIHEQDKISFRVFWQESLEGAQEVVNFYKMFNVISWVCISTPPVWRKNE